VRVAHQGLIKPCEWRAASVLYTLQ
jgi:uncharacterized protein Usg